MDNDRMDLTALDPRADELGWERLVRSIVAAAGPELARRRASPVSALGMLGSWARPALSAAAIIAMLAVGALAVTERSAVAAEAPGTVADALGVPEPVSDWLTEGRGPTAADLVLAMERR